MNPVSTDLVDPLEASRHPFEVYLLVLAACSGVPLLFGEPNSGSINEAMPPLVVNMWGAMLVFGSVLALLGLYWRGRKVTGLLMERTGLVGVGGAALIFAVVAFSTVGVTATFSACITGGFGAACFTQAHRIGQRVRMAIYQAGGGP